MIHILHAHSTQSALWDSYVDGCADAGPYHRWAWLDAIHQAYGFRAVPLLALRSGKATGVLPLVLLGLPGRRGRLISLPYCDFGGPLADDDAAREKLLGHALELARAWGLDGVDVRRQSSRGVGTTKVLMRKLLPGGAKELFDSFPAKLRSQIRKPQREGLNTATGGEELLEDFYRVYARNMRDLGSPPHALGWFRAVLRGFAHRARVTVVSLQDGEPAAAGITMVQGATSFVPWASSLREHNPLSPNMLLYWTMLSQAAESGLKAFEFGRSTPGEGTHNFKKQWGAQQIGLAWQRFDPSTGVMRPLSALGKARPRQLAEACWRYLPLGMANAAGPILRRYISL